MTLEGPFDFGRSSDSHPGPVFPWGKPQGVQILQPLPLECGRGREEEKGCIGEREGGKETDMKCQKLSQGSREEGLLLCTFPSLIDSLLSSFLPPPRLYLWVGILPLK